MRTVPPYPYSSRAGRSESGGVCGCSSAPDISCGGVREVAAEGDDDRVTATEVGGLSRLDCRARAGSEPEVLEVCGQTVGLVRLPGHDEEPFGKRGGHQCRGEGLPDGTRPDDPDHRPAH